MRDKRSAHSLVMRGLDPRIHRLCRIHFFEGWIARSSPAMASAELVRFIAVRMTAPSLLVGVGIAAGRHKLSRVRGTVSRTSMRRQPLTRPRFAQAPSPTRGEGKAAQVGTRIAVRVTAPSPLVGEGITAARTALGWVRGSHHEFTMPRQPLTRLRFAQPPSPTGGEGKKRLPQRHPSS